MAHLALSLLGPFAATLGAVPITFRYEKLRALLAYLTVERDQAHPREALVGLLWPDASEGHARRNLSQALFNLRQLLGEGSAVAPPATPFLLVTRATVQFNPASDFTLDAAEFQQLLSRPASLAPAETAEQIRRAVEWYRGDFLQHIYMPDSSAFEEWALLKREELRRLALGALGQLTADYERQGNYATAQRYTRRQLELEPWREEAHCDLMRLLARSGDRSAALAQYETCRQMLADELGVEPAEATRALYEQIKANTFPDRSSPTATKPATEVRTLPPPLPAQLTSFVGRERELAEIGRLLLDPHCRLLSVAGPGGMGKTRLALQAAARHGAAFADGTAFVSLASLQTGDLFSAALAEAVGLALTSAGEAKAQILGHLSGRQMLLVLDNFEHLAAQAAALNAVQELLQAAPGLKLLVTSRERLELSSEWVYEVEGLGEAALTLFAQSARRAHAGFELEAAETDTVRRICSMVGGWPLAVELAAGWVHVLSSAEIAREIERSLGFLSAATRALPERHRSMQAVFDQSWQRLAEAERRALCRLAVFRNGFSRRAAEQVADTTLSLMSVLMAKSLLHRAQPGRYDMHEMVRQFALTKLADDPSAERLARQRHSEYFSDFLAQRRERLIGGDQRAALGEMAQDADNVQAAWGWLVELGEASRLGQMAPGLAWLYELQNAYRQGIAVFGQAAEALAARSNDEGLILAVLECRVRQAFFYFRVGERARARAQFQSCVAALQPLDQAALQMDCLVFLGFVNWQMGHFSDAVAAAGAGLALADQAGSPWHQNLACSTLGLAARARGEYEEARQRLTQAAGIAKAAELHRATALGLAYLAGVHAELGQPEPAEALAGEALEVARRLDEAWCVGVALTYGAFAAQAHGDFARARELAGESVHTFARIEDNWRWAQALVRLGQAQAALAATAEAATAFETAFRLARKSETPPVALAAVVGLAALYAHAGAAAAAYGWLHVVRQHPATAHADKAAAEGLAAQWEAQLTTEQIAAANRWATGASLDDLAPQLAEAQRALSATD